MHYIELRRFVTSKGLVGVRFSKWVWYVVTKYMYIYIYIRALSFFRAVLAGPLRCLCMLQLACQPNRLGLYGRRVGTGRCAYSTRALWESPPLERERWRKMHSSEAVLKAAVYSSLGTWMSYLRPQVRTGSGVVCEHGLGFRPAMATH